MEDIIFNTRNPDWIKGEIIGVSLLADCVMVSKNCIIFNNHQIYKYTHINDIKNDSSFQTNLNKCKIIAIYSKYNFGILDIFIDNILGMLSKQVNIIICGEDITFPNSLDKRFKNISTLRKRKFIKFIKHDNINKVFVENLDEKIDKTISIPVGINVKECIHSFKYFKKFEKIDPNKPLMVTNFNRIRTGHQWCERYYVKNQIINFWSKFAIDFSDQSYKHSDFLQLLSKYPFTICVHGGGVDPCPKLYESILVGTIPIVINNTILTYLYDDLPIVFLNSWESNEITVDKLKFWHNKFYHYYTDIKLRNQVLNKLSLKYWKNIIET